MMPVKSAKVESSSKKSKKLFPPKVPKMASPAHSNKPFIIALITVVAIIGLTLLLLNADKLAGKAAFSGKVNIQEPSLQKIHIDTSSRQLTPPLGPDDVRVEIELVPSEIKVGDKFWAQVYLTPGGHEDIYAALVILETTDKTADVVRFTGEGTEAVGQISNMFNKENFHFKRIFNDYSWAYIAANLNYLSSDSPTPIISPPLSKPYPIDPLNKYYLGSLEMEAVGAGQFSLTVDSDDETVDGNIGSEVTYSSNNGGSFNIVVKGAGSCVKGTQESQCSGSVCSTVDDGCGGFIDCGECPVDSDGDGVDDDLEPAGCVGVVGNVYSSGSFAGCLLGDVNGGGCVNSEDVNIILQHINLFCEPNNNDDKTPEQGDTNGDGCVKADDINNVIQNIDIFCSE